MNKKEERLHIIENYRAWTKANDEKEKNDRVSEIKKILSYFSERKERVKDLIEIGRMMQKNGFIEPSKKVTATHLGFMPSGEISYIGVVADAAGRDSGAYDLYINEEKCVLKLQCDEECNDNRTFLMKNGEISDEGIRKLKDIATNRISSTIHYLNIAKDEFSTFEYNIYAIIDEMQKMMTKDNEHEKEKTELPAEFKQLEEQIIHRLKLRHGQFDEMCLTEKERLITEMKQILQCL